MWYNSLRQPQSMDDGVCRCVTFGTAFSRAVSVSACSCDMHTCSLWETVETVLEADGTAAVISDHCHIAVKSCRQCREVVRASRTLHLQSLQRGTAASQCDMAPLALIILPACKFPSARL